jgi:hypothetical protein
MRIRDGVPLKLDAFAISIRHARVILTGIHDFQDLQAGFPTKTDSGMIFRETLKLEYRGSARFCQRETRDNFHC